MTPHLRKRSIEPITQEIQQKIYDLNVEKKPPAIYVFMFVNLKNQNKKSFRFFFFLLNRQTYFRFDSTLII